MTAPNTRRLPPPLEMEAMKELWRLGEATVREVQERLSFRRPLAYTTVMTLLDRLARKGAAGRRKQGRAHVYYPLFSRDAARDVALDRLTADFFEGSRQSLLAHLGGEPIAPPGSRPAEETLDATLL